MQEIARMREKALHDEASTLKETRDEECAERDVEIASNMWIAGFPEEDIQKALGVNGRG